MRPLPQSPRARWPQPRAPRQQQGRNIKRPVSAARFFVGVGLSWAATSAALTFALSPVPPPLPVLTPQPITNFRNPPPYRKLTDAEFERYDLGMTVFNTQFVAAGTANAGRRDGVGPLFNASACDQCHNNGAHGRGPTEDGPAQAPLVIQLALLSSPPSHAADPDGDPVYGRVFNTSSLGRVATEGVAMIRYEETVGHYPDGSTWHLRVPTYSLTDLHYGPLSPQTIVKPRLAPALFGVAMLENPGESVAATDGKPVPTAPAARFGWQATASSVRDQTARAFSREMGLTSSDFATDDCTPAEKACRRAPNGGSPEVSDDFLDAVVKFQNFLAVPQSPSPHPRPDVGLKVFVQIGCAGCHKPERVFGGDNTNSTIEPYSDLRLHNLGDRLADMTVSGQKVPSEFRTAPLWGMGYRVSFERHPTFLHDGRARSVEEAILWHDGEAASVRENFEKLPAQQRTAFLHWVETL
jgi:CxxC motif-containing protein (DUF1111 family)